MTYQPDEAFAGLFFAFTGGQPESIGAQLTQTMVSQSQESPLLVSTASDIAYFPGGHSKPSIESFRKSTRGFIELTAVSHLPLAVCYVAHMRELLPGAETWRIQLQRLIEHAVATRCVNTVEMWRDKVALRAFRGHERKLCGLVEYALTSCIDYMQRACIDPSLLDFETLQRQFIDADQDWLPVSMNDVMFATFALSYVDIAYRIGGWLREQQIDWDHAMVLVSGQSGRPTAGVTWSTNNICNLIWKSSDKQIAPERIFVAPHAPGFSVDNLPNAEALRDLEKTYRQIWCHTRASVDVARKMFQAYEAFTFRPIEAEALPAIKSLGDHAACVARLRRIMEDPQQLLSNCVADYIIDELHRCNHQPEDVQIPGFTNVDY
ncbi:MAG TPA: DUF5624 domain-containing protein [Pseudolabrys sp.]